MYARVYTWDQGREALAHVGDAANKREEVAMRQAAAQSAKNVKVISYRQGRDKPVVGIHLK